MNIESKDVPAIMAKENETFSFKCSLWQSFIRIPFRCNNLFVFQVNDTFEYFPFEEMFVCHFDRLQKL